ncbi:MAG: CRTAC1 family protein [Myxococcales bacterium]|nr:CRTAC1 family protein [Myxococcales bacterium]
MDAPDVATAPTSPSVDPETLPLAAFTDVTAQYGVDPAKWHEYCVAVADFDGNGREDFVVIERVNTKATVHAALLGPGAPVHVMTDLDTSLTSASFGCSAVDMDGDAKPDLIFGGYSGASVYGGNGKGGFVDKTKEWMPYITDYAAFSVQPADLDGDGDLDLYIGAGFEPPPCSGLSCQYTESDLVCSFAVFPPTKKMNDRVLIQGSKLPMADVTDAWQVPTGGNQTVVLALDVDEDGKMDILAGDENDGHRLLRNLGGKFAVHDVDIGFHPWAAAMGWAVGDLNGDGLFDLVLADAGPTPAYLQAAAKPGKPAQFLDGGGTLGVWGPSWGASAWSPLIADLDLDGLDDLLLGISVNMTAEQLAEFVSSCGLTMGKQNPFSSKPSIDVLYTHGKGPALVATALPHGPYAHGLFVDHRLIDLDADGDLDVVQTRPGPSMKPSARVRILRNDLAKQGKYMVVVVEGKGLNRDALGTRVTAKVNGSVRKRWLNGSGGWGGSSTRFAHFGLGGADQATDVTVHWPDGTKTLVGDVAAGATKTAVWK